MLVKHRFLLVNFAVLVSTLTLLELISFAFLRVRETQTPSANQLSNSSLLKTWNFEMHPGVSHSHIRSDFIKSPNARRSISNNNLYTEKPYGNSDRRMSVLTLGGSTTDPLAVEYAGLEGTWPDHLGEILKSRGININLLNAGVAGATSSQELLRLTTIMHERNIDLAISYSGINEVYFARDKRLHSPENVLANGMVTSGIANGLIKTDSRTFWSSQLARLKWNVVPLIKSLSTAKIFKRIMLRYSSGNPLTFGDSNS